MNMLLHPTPIAATAIIAQIECNADAGGDKFYADVNGQEWEFTAKFTVDWSHYCEHRGGHGHAECTLIGAYSYDAHGDVQFAGNRRELVDLIGEAKVAQWELTQGEEE